MGLDKDIQALLDAEEQANQPEFTEEDVRQLVIYWSTLLRNKDILPADRREVALVCLDTRTSNPKLWEAISAIIGQGTLATDLRSRSAPHPSTPYPYWFKHADFNNKYSPKLSLDIKPIL